MFRPIVCVAFLMTVVSTAVVPETPKTSNNFNAQLLIVDDITKLQLERGAELVPLIGIQEKSQIRYILGNRMANDGLVSQGSDYYQWNAPKDVQLQLAYPANGVGAILTFVDIIVDQSSTVGRAYVISGGIGQRSIVIVVEAYNTYWFNYVAKFYGIY